MLPEPYVVVFLILCPKYDNWSPLVHFFFLSAVSFALLVLCLILLALSKASLNSSLSGHGKSVFLLAHVHKHACQKTLNFFVTVVAYTIIASPTLEC